MKITRSFLANLSCMLAVAICLCVPASVNAGGLIGDIVNVVIPGAGTTLDDAHRQIKEAIPPYKAIEEGTSKTVNETLVQAGAPALQELIARSRDDALQNGVQPIPPDIRQNLSGFIPESVLNVARYRVNGGGDLTLQVNAIRYGEARAITLDYVIVFKDLNDALYNPTLWAHELTHVGQYQSWGIHDFAIRYLRDYQSVESEAYNAETRYVAWAGLKNTQQWTAANAQINPAMVNHPVASFSFNNNSNTCSTAIATCQVNGIAPVGTPCWCNTSFGAATGSLIPNTAVPANFTSPVPMGLPTGSVMRVCGCWGPNPSVVGFEPRCASGRVQVSACLGFCAPGQPVYGYICQ